MPEKAIVYEEFGGEFRDEQRRLMRTRVLWYLIVSNAFNLMGLAISGLLVFVAESGMLEALVRASGEQTGGRAEYGMNRITVWSGLLLSVPGAALYIWALVRVLRRPIDRAAGLRLVYWLIVLSSSVTIIGALAFAEIGALIEGERASAEALADGVGWGGTLAVLLSHFFACIFLPWTPRESLRPLWPLLVINTLVATYALWGSWGEIATVIALSMLLITPGIGLCWLKNARFTKRFVDRRLRSAYGELRHELSAARQIHDAMFPEPVTDGPIRVDYRYEPMRQIGGDYVFVRRSDEAVDVVLIDVTGHGVGAALTVNRLHGEVTRLLAERPGCGPGELLTGLNRYLHITLARHSVYATAFACRVETGGGGVRYASAGHPPAYLTGDGREREALESTTYILGVVGVDDFDAGEAVATMGRGDRLIAYTDGATEAMDEKGRQFRIGGIERTIDGLRSTDGSWLDAIVGAVEGHRSGAAQDDTLIVEVLRP
ncbi:MAG: PP2C family protein-serine/threonine phosphatase [Planctomycetota bacterium]